MPEIQSTLSNPNITATFRIFAAGTEWGSIVGTLSDQTDLQEALDAKEDVISADNKLNADFVDDTDTTNKFVTTEEISTWNAKQNAITPSDKLSSDLVTDANATNKFVTTTQINTWNAKQNAITLSNMLQSDLVNDTNQTHKFVTSSQISTWNAKQDAISDLSTIRANATDGKSAYTTIQTYGNIVTHNVSEFATAAQGALADSAIQPNDNISELTNNAGYITKDVNNLTNYTTTTNLNTALSGKQDVISDLATIRAGATAGATALQSQEYGTIVINI